MTYSIGLDIGIASVGWAVIDSATGRIDDLGVNLFTARNSDNNEERRKSRGQRRLIRRRKTRLNDAKKFLETKGFIVDPIDNTTSPYELRVKGLTSPLTKSEIAKAVLHLIKKRGVAYLDDEHPEESNNISDYKQKVQDNLMQLKEKTPGQIQLERLNEKGRVRTGYNQEGEYQLNVFTVSAYAKELQRILETQAKHHPEIDQAFIDRFCLKASGEKAGLIYRKRPYYHGPGNAANPSHFGRWSNYPETGVPAENIFQQLIGTDLTGQIRAASIAPTAQVYNLLNDLNNLTIKREHPKLSTEEKASIIDYLIQTDVATFGPKQLAKQLNVAEEAIFGWRVDKNNKKLLHNLKVFRKWKKLFAADGLDMMNYDFSVLDEIASIVTLNTDKESVEATLKVKISDIPDDLKYFVLNNYKELKKNDSNAVWHSFSIPTLNILIPELLNTSAEQNTILESLGIKKSLREQYAELNKLPIKPVLEEIYNPTVQRSVRKAIQVLNALVNRYGKDNISHITIEMPRDKNEDDAKKNIAKMQKDNENRKKKAIEYFKQKSNWDQVRLDYEIGKRKKLLSKINYYYEQDGQCAYSGKPILPEDLLSDATEIDHIIPLSISLDDSMNNKVLVTASANQAKGQRSPYQAFTETSGMGRSYDEFKVWVESRPFSKKKKEMLLEERDIFDPEIRQKFVARNLNDTRYASRTVLQAVQSFFYKSGTKVSVVNGAFTHTLRKKWGANLEKERATHYHHAVDACLCAVKPFVTISVFKYQVNEDGQKIMIDTIKNIQYPYYEFKKQSFYERRSYIPKWDNFIARLLPTDLYRRVKFSHQVDQKPNRKISDATLYSTRDVKKDVLKRGKTVQEVETYVIGKIKDIYTVGGYNDYLKYKDHLLMKDLDPQTFDLLNEIVNKYKAEIDDPKNTSKKIAVSPFKRYAELNNVAGVQKYSKKGNGPIIKSLKYYDKRLKTHLNITKDAHGQSIDRTQNGKAVVLQSLDPWRTDVYRNPETGKYHLVGIKYYHLRFVNGKYGVPQSVYLSLLEKEKVLANYEFMFSLYRKDRIKITYQGQSVEGLYHSRTKESNPNYFEMKPIDKSKWADKETVGFFGSVTPNGQFTKSIKEGMEIHKLNTDPLGKTFESRNEALLNIIKD